MVILHDKRNILNYSQTCFKWKVKPYAETSGSFIQGLNVWHCCLETMLNTCCSVLNTCWVCL